MKNSGNHKGLRLLVLAVTVLLAAAVLTGCGPKTLEDKVNDDPDLKTELDDLGKKFEETNGIKTGGVSIKENTVILNVTMDVTTDETTESLYVNALETSFAEQESVFVNSVKQIQEDTEIEGVRFQIVVADTEGVSLFDKTYDENGEVKS